MRGHTRAVLALLAVSLGRCAAFGLQPALVVKLHGASVRCRVPLAVEGTLEGASASDAELLQARLALVGASALWGTYPTFLKLLYAAEGAELAPPTITALRFALMAGVGVAITSAEGGAATAAAVDADQQEQSAPDGFVLAATELGFWGCCGTQLNSLGLLELSAVRATLLLSTVNILTPLLQSLFGTVAQREIGPRVWAACVLALACTVYAVTDGGASLVAAADGTSTPFAPIVEGDKYVLCAAACYAMQKVRLGVHVQRHRSQLLAAGRLQSQALLSFVILGGGALLATFGTGAQLGTGGGGGGLDNLADLAAGLANEVGTGLTSAAGWSAQLTPLQLALLAASAFLPGAGATILQAAGQRVVPAANAQPIYASMPLFAAGWACLLLHEPVSGAEVVGGVGTCVAAPFHLNSPSLPPRPCRLGLASASLGLGADFHGPQVRCGSPRHRRRGVASAERGSGKGAESKGGRPP